MKLLNFPNAQDFFNYLMEQKIHRYGVVSKMQVLKGEQGVGIYKESFRLSAINDRKNELLRCDLSYYQDIYVTQQHCSEEAKEPKEKTLKWLQEKIKEWTGKYQLTLLHCEFQEA